MLFGRRQELPDKGHQSLSVGRGKFVQAIYQQVKRIHASLKKLARERLLFLLGNDFLNEGKPLAGEVLAVAVGLHRAEKHQELLEGCLLNRGHGLGSDGLL